MAAKAPNGTPKIGIVDATSPCCTCETADGWSCDLTMRKAGVSFAIGLAPGCGAVHVATDGAGPVQLSDSVVASSGEPESYWAVLKWPALGNEEAKWNMSIHTGVFLEKGNLTFYRKEQDGSWCSSGIICKNLPERVVPCMFMSSFVGYAKMRFVKMMKSPPAVNGRSPKCNMQHGTKHGWRRLG
eukprot:gnl/TRDRNA2_/TRDRNA2_60265_c0_seq1.p1 gnl/TRDRNA2_/TRDRNA2_60265_c0~~gnl/TRDRNA2_/TRDRNA2_60265_c0_seq1.p1  ORF type:complete len:211 (-),score=19.50 gnl/TRDRNA2_/TRDRNA2_60265_c0_seq1:45-599(-)